MSFSLRNFTIQFALTKAPEEFTFEVELDPEEAERGKDNLVKAILTSLLEGDGNQAFVSSLALFLLKEASQDESLHLQVDHLLEQARDNARLVAFDGEESYEGTLLLVGLYGLENFLNEYPKEEDDDIDDFFYYRYDQVADAMEMAFSVSLKDDPNGLIDDIDSMKELVDVCDQATLLSNSSLQASEAENLCRLASLKEIASYGEQVDVAIYESPADYYWKEGIEVKPCPETLRPYIDADAIGRDLLQGESNVYFDDNDRVYIIRE